MLIAVHVQQLMPDRIGQIGTFRFVDIGEGKAELFAAKHFHHIVLIEKDVAAIWRTEMGMLRPDFVDIAITITLKPWIAKFDFGRCHLASRLIVGGILRLGEGCSHPAGYASGQPPTQPPDTDQPCKIKGMYFPAG